MDFDEVFLIDRLIEEEAAVPGFALVLGNFTIPTIMAKFGRKIGNIVSVVVVILGWMCIVAADSFALLLVARLLQGLSMGMSTSLGPILIGEYTSPRNRGPFLSTMGLAMSIMTLIVHTLGSFTTWRITAVVCTVLSAVNLIVVIFSPESPSWLAEQGRYEDSKRAFHWLRGHDEEEELKKMLEANQLARESKTEANITELSFGKKLRRNIGYFNSTIKKKEFYKPIFIVIHMYMIAHWGGINLISAFTLDTFHYVIGDNMKYNAIMIITLDIQRIISNTAAVFVMKRVKRRTMLFITMVINILALVATAVYAYAKMHDLLGYDHIVFGALLIHIHTFSVVTGSLPLPMVISGEIFPMKYRSLAGGISALFYSLNFFLTVKTVLFLFSTVQFYGAYLIYAGVLTYCLIIAWFFLPETKDRTLQDIEEEFKGNKMSPEDLKSAQSLKSLNGTSS